MKQHNITLEAFSPVINVMEEVIKMQAAAAQLQANLLADYYEEKGHISLAKYLRKESLPKTIYCAPRLYQSALSCFYWMGIAVKKHNHLPVGQIVFSWFDENELFNGTSKNNKIISL